MAPLIVHSAHQPGLHTCLAFSHDGLTLHTGGEDGLVRTWPSDLGGGKEPEPADEAEEAITSVATSKTCWLSASLDSCVRKYDAHRTSMEGFVTRSIAVPVRCVAIDPKGERVAVTSDELEIKIISLNDITSIWKLEGHRKGVRKATWHPSGTLLTTCGSEGDIIVWDVSPGEEPKQIERISGIIPTADFESSEFAHDCSAVWHPSGKYFVVASRAHEITVVSRDKWQKTSVFSDDNVTGATTALAISPNGTYLASACKPGIFVWSTATRKVLFRHVPNSSPPLVLQLVFSPTQNLLAWTDVEGNLVRWPDPIPESSPDPIKAHSTSSSIGVVAKKSDPLLLDNDTKDKSDNQASDDAVPDDGYELDDDWMIDDIGLLDKAENQDDSDEKGFTREMVSVTKGQQPFQPASTPMINKKRYLAYNMIGVIEVTEQDTHHIINVEFHDRSTRAGSHFQDLQKIDTASLGERGVLYACPIEDRHPAQIIYKPYAGWASSGEWQHSLPDGEKVVALAAGGIRPSKSLREQQSEGDLEGNGNVVVGTNRGYLRFFTGGGVQRYIWALGADVVSMVAGREWVFVVHRDGGTSLDGCQNLSYVLIAWDTFDVVQRGQLPLPRGSVLKWIGISEEGAPSMYDSNGLLSILDRFRRAGQGRWIPILDTKTLARRKGKDESYWPVGVSGTLFMCLILKGREENPGFPRPLIQELEVQMPLFNLDAPQGQMEERFLREELHVGMLRDALGTALTSQEISRRELGLDKELLQLIQLACKSDKLQRALDSASLLHNTKSFDMAIKVAEFYHLVGLQEKMLILKSEREKSDRLQEEKEQRKNWARQSAPITAPQSHVGSSSYRRQAQEFAPRSAIVGKLLAPATPIVNGQNKSRSGIGPVFGQEPKDSDPSPSVQPPDTDASPWDDSFDIDASICDVSRSSTIVRKRSREASSPEADLPGASPTKKRGLPGVTPSGATVSKPSNKSSNNPFARKPQNLRNDSMSLPVRSKTHIAKKSHSFFERVDQANDIAQAKGTVRKSDIKLKEKETSRQTTLFGLPPGPAIEKKDKPRQEKEGVDNFTTRVPLGPTASVSVSKAETTSMIVDTQFSDAMMDDGTLQSLPEDDPQPSDKPQTRQGMSPEPEIEWPLSPPRGCERTSAEVTVN